MESAQRFIVCGVDGSPAGERALRWAVDEAVVRGGRVRAVTAWTWADGVEELVAPSSPAEELARAGRLLENAVEAAVSGMPKQPAVERVLRRGVPSDVLCAAAVDADLLVLGSHGHGTVHDKLLGSTSERALHHAPCPVVIVPDPRQVEKNVKRAQEQQRRLSADPRVQVV